MRAHPLNCELSVNVVSYQRDASFAGVTFDKVELSIVSTLFTFRPPFPHRANPIEPTTTAMKSSRAFVPSIPLHKSSSSSVHPSLTPVAAHSPVVDPPAPPDDLRPRPSPADWLRANELSLPNRSDALRLSHPSHTPHRRSVRPSAPISIPSPTRSTGRSTTPHRPPPSPSSISSYASSYSPTSSPPSGSVTPPPPNTPANCTTNSSTTANSSTASSPGTGSRPRATHPSGAPRVLHAPDIISSTPPSYCPVGFDLQHARADLDARLSYLGPVARNKVLQVLSLAMASGVTRPTLAHNLSVTLIAADLQMDCDTVCAAVLHDVTVDPRALDPDVHRILTLHRRLQDSVALCGDNDSFTEVSFSNLRELLLVQAVDEHRAISLELARAVLSMRTVDALPSAREQRLVARRCMHLYAPLANQLGIWFVQSELEELAFMHLEPAAFEAVRHLVGERRRECEHMLKDSKHLLEIALSQTWPIRNTVRSVHIKGRVKGLYSVYRKMKKSGKRVSEIYDLLALRVVVQPKKADADAERNACYAVQEVIRQHYDTFGQREKDYIESPKHNGYRSLHMTVLPHGGKTPLEIQIRTEKMHHVAEFGAAAHWIYKEENGDAESSDKDSLKTDSDTSPFVVDSDVESIVSDSDSDTESDFDPSERNGRLVFNFEEATAGRTDNQSIRTPSQEETVPVGAGRTRGQTRLGPAPGERLRTRTASSSEYLHSINSIGRSKRLSLHERKKEQNNKRDDDDDDDDQSNNSNNNSGISNSNNKNNSHGHQQRESGASSPLSSSSRFLHMLNMRSQVPSQRRHAQQHPPVTRYKVGSTTSSSKYPRPRVPLTDDAKKRMEELEMKRQSLSRNGSSEVYSDLQHELRSGYVNCLASAIRASTVIVATAGQLYGLAVGSTLADLASRLGVATLGAIAVVNGQIVPLTQRLNMNDMVQFITL